MVKQEIRSLLDGLDERETYRAGYIDNDRDRNFLVAIAHTTPHRAQRRER
jgi:hypothetical protein